MTLAVDGASEPLVLWEIPVENRQLVVTSRSTLGVPSNQRFDLPLLTGDEIVAWVTALRKGYVPIRLNLLVSLPEAAGIRFTYVFLRSAGGASADLSLQELEVRAVQSLPPRPREITSYLALAPRPFSLGDLHALVGAEEGPEAVAEQVVNCERAAEADTRSGNARTRAPSCNYFGSTTSGPQHAWHSSRAASDGSSKTQSVIWQPLMCTSRLTSTMPCGSRSRAGRQSGSTDGRRGTQQSPYSVGRQNSLRRAAPSKSGCMRFWH